MSELLIFLMAAIQITLLDIVLSGDNVGLIALAIRRLPEKQARLATLVGVGGAIGFRILFASLITVIMAIDWLPIKLIGGLLLLKITWSLLNAEEDLHQKKVRDNNTFRKAVMSIILADISMSLDNVIAVGGAAHGNIGLIIFGILLNLPIIFFGAQYIADLMNKYRLLIYIGAGILIHTAFDMIFSDLIIAPYIPHLVAIIVPWVLGLLVIGYGYYVIQKEKIAAKEKAEADAAKSIVPEKERSGKKEVQKEPVDYGRPYRRMCMYRWIKLYNQPSSRARAYNELSKYFNRKAE